MSPVWRARSAGEFVQSHPFVDGNGRTARLLLNLALLKAGYRPIVRNARDFANGCPITELPLAMMMVYRRCLSGFAFLVQRHDLGFICQCFDD